MKKNQNMCLSIMEWFGMMKYAQLHLFLIMKEAEQESRTALDPPIETFETGRLNADNSDRKNVFIFWFIFASLLVIVFISSNYTPSALIFKSNRIELSDTHHKDCLNPVSFQNGLLVCNQFSVHNPQLGLVMRNLSPLNQFAQINLVILPINQGMQPLQIKQTINVELMSLKRTEIVSSNKTYIGFQKGEDVKKIDSIQFHTQTYYLQQLVTDEAKVEYGYQINLGYYRQFKTSDALLIVKFVNIDWQLFKSYKLVLVAILMNENYTKFMMVMRGIFLGIMVISGGIYLHRLQLINRRFTYPEQRMVVSLSVSVILFNDPYYFIGVFKPNVLSVFFQTLFVSLFLMMLFSCWVYMLQKINTQSRGEDYIISKWRKFVNLLAALDCFAIIFAFNYQISYYAFNDSPIVPNHKVFSGLFYLIVVFFSLVFAYILYLYVKLFLIWENVIWRNKLYAVFNIFFIFLMLIFISLGWFSLYDESSQKFEIFYASLNIYVLYMQFMYTRPFGEETTQNSSDFVMITEMSMDINDTFSVNQPAVELEGDKDYKSYVLTKQ